MKRELIKQLNKEKSIKTLNRLQSLPLEQKVNLSLRRISDFYNFTEGKIYVSFSGGKDSTVLLHLVRSLFPETKAMFVDTGLEYSSIRDFVKSIRNVDWVKPKMRFDQVIKEKGYPVVSKEVSHFVKDLQNPKPSNERTRRIRLEGSSFKGGKSRTGMLSYKWRFLKDAPFKCSDQCCDVMKKNPAKNYTKSTGLNPIIGTMSCESRLRQQLWLKSGCNLISKNQSKSSPLSFWRDSDVWEYIKSRQINYADIYDKGADRTGCVFCLFGYFSKNDFKSQNDRMELLKRVEPKKYEYCMKDLSFGGLGLGSVIDYIDRKLRHGQLEFDFAC